MKLCSVDQFWGEVSIAADGVSVKRSPLAKRYRERHAVVFSPASGRVLVDSRVIYERPGC